MFYPISSFKLEALHILDSRKVSYCIWSFFPDGENYLNFSWKKFQYIYKWERENNNHRLPWTQFINYWIGDIFVIASNLMSVNTFGNKKEWVSHLFIWPAIQRSLKVIELLYLIKLKIIPPIGTSRRCKQFSRYFHTEGSKFWIKKFI